MNINLNDFEGYKDLRKTLQSGTGINRDKIFNTENPFDFIQKSYDELGVSMDQFKQAQKYSPKWFNDITNEYLKLDMHGYQEDKVNIKKGRKETFRNTTDDGFHAAFASTCNIYVINDNKSYKKTKKVYEKLNINTRIFKPNEFMDFYRRYLSYNDPVLDFRTIREVINSENFYESETEEGITRVYYFPYFLFGFFNKIVCFYPIDEKEDILTFLSQDKPSNSFIISKEVELVVKRLLKYFGNDINSDGELKPNEFNMERWEGRKWNFESLTLRLQAINGFVQLYFEYED